jgi:hypothetical protein
MKIAPLVNILALLILAESTTACEVTSTYANNQRSSEPKPIMTNNTSLVKKVTLIAREQNRPPLGVPVDPQRNIGFASVFVRLENPQANPITVTITNVEIRNLADGKLQNFKQPPQKINLKPLENSEVVFQLANKTGYIGKDKVKVVVIYKIGKKTSIIESESVEISR